MKRRLFMFAAPAIVAAPSLMRVSALRMPEPLPVYIFLARIWMVPPLEWSYPEWTEWTGILNPPDAATVS